MELHVHFKKQVHLHAGLAGGLAGGLARLVELAVAALLGGALGLLRNLQGARDGALLARGLHAGLLGLGAQLLNGHLGQLHAASSQRGGLGGAASQVDVRGGLHGASGQLGGGRGGDLTSS
jgi:hypothetical protein